MPPKVAHPEMGWLDMVLGLPKQKQGAGHPNQRPHCPLRLPQVGALAVVLDDDAAHPRVGRRSGAALLPLLQRHRHVPLVCLPVGGEGGGGSGVWKVGTASHPKQQGFS